MLYQFQSDYWKSLMVVVLIYLTTKLKVLRANCVQKQKLSHNVFSNKNK